MSEIENGQWIWHSSKIQNRSKADSALKDFNVTVTGSTGTTEFPDRLTHSYFVDLDEEKPGNVLQLQPPNLLEGILSLLALSLIGNGGTVIYQVKKCIRMDKDDTRIIRRWIRISSSSGKVKEFFS